MNQSARSSEAVTVPEEERCADDAFRATEVLQRAIRVDPVSGLPNRREFIDNFGFGVTDAPSHEGDVIVLFLLDTPQQFNNMVRALGHSFADETIRLGANRLRGLLPDSVQIYHISPYSFAFALPAAEGNAPPALLAEVTRVFAEPMMCSGIPVRNRIGLGLNRVSEHSADPSELLRGAVVAARDGRKSGEGWAWYDRGSDQAHLRSFRLLADMGRFLDAGLDQSDDQFSLYYQPKIDLQTGACCGVEALMRWTHPSFGFVSPAEFVPLAETTAMVTPLTRWVFQRSVAQRAAWKEAGMDVPISINVSPINLSEPDFADFALETCAARSVSPEGVEIEFTESAQTLDSQLTLTQLTRLREAGVSVAIDDFGSGYSNMRYLREIPADRLKIDKGFILTLDSCEKNQKIVPTIIELGHHLGLKIVAEGIENANAYEALAGWGCDEGQGFYMSKPLAEPDFRAWLMAQAKAA